MDVTGYFGHSDRPRQTIRRPVLVDAREGPLLALIRLFRPLYALRCYAFRHCGLLLFRPSFSRPLLLRPSGPPPPPADNISTLIAH